MPKNQTFKSKLGQKKLFLKAKFGQKIKKKKNCPKTQFLSQNWGKNGKNGTKSEEKGEKRQKFKEKIFLSRNWGKTDTFLK